MSAKIKISKGFIVYGMEGERSQKMQTVSFKQGKQTSYIQIHIDENIRKQQKHLLIKGQQVSIEGNFSCITSQYKGVYQKNPVIWVEKLSLEFTPEQIAERAKKLSAGEKVDVEGKDTKTVVSTPSAEVVEPSIKVDLPMEAPTQQPEITEEEIVLTTPKQEENKNNEIEHPSYEPKQEVAKENHNKELSDEDILNMLN